MGHGIGAALVGALAFAVRGALNIDTFSVYMEAVVGLSIVIIGINGVREAREWAVECHTDDASEAAEVAQADEAVRFPASSIQMSGEGVPGAMETRETGRVSTLLTGILHGMTGSGHLLGVMPALAMPGWVCAGSYLGCFGLGTLLAMAAFTAAVGELSCQMSARLDDPSTPAKLAMASSIFALCVGAAWTARAMMAFELPLARWWAQLWALRRAAAMA